VGKASNALESFVTSSRCSSTLDCPLCIAEAKAALSCVCAVKAAVRALLNYSNGIRLTSTQKHYLQLQYLQGMGFKSVWFEDLRRITDRVTSTSKQPRCCKKSGERKSRTPY
jgi:hypothetical protein